MAFILYLSWPFLLFTLSTGIQCCHFCNIALNDLARKGTIDIKLFFVTMTEVEHCLMILLAYQVFDEYSQINRHQRAFHGGRRFPCGLCEKEFTRPDKLKLHMLRCPALVAANWFSSSVLFARSFFAIYLFSVSIYASLETYGNATVTDDVLLNVSIIFIC